MEFDYTSVNNSFVYNLVKLPLWIASHITYKYRCKGRKNIPSEGRLIIACNHVAFSDPALIVVNCPRKIHYMAKSDLFENPAFALLLTKMNAFPVKRWTADRNALKYAIKVLESEGVLGIFPEGRRVRGGVQPVEARKGIGYIAKKTGADVLPCCIYKIKKRYRSELVLVFGTVIKNSELFSADEKSTSSDSAKAASSIIMDRIKELWLNQEKFFKPQKQQDSASE
ncbi:MAG: 1-acyl-sn-glycerol-3-phosphate acyltransferase [Clostridia bacterium]|nr:1-acyl-sn-glycerol-3-phosphate acyltransferase [Clostridia bacterium]